MKKQTKIVSCVLLLAAMVTIYSFSDRTGPSDFLSVVQTDVGKVSGTKNNDGDVTAFKGIPFAAPPVGNLRWKAPQPVPHWNGVKKCDAFGPSPMQPKPAPFMVYTSEFLIPEKPISEDCLYLNVWTNAKSKTDKKPVFVWIYGGGFGSGGTACPIYDGEAMAKKGIIFVSINYRVGVFGFFAYPELTKESPDHASGNYALLDQLAGLKWIKKNIAAFGGDPDNVTIAGQSAGSMSVNCLVASPQAKRLFERAIAESGSLLVKNPNLASNTLKTAEDQGAKLAEKAGAKSINDLRAMTAEDAMSKLRGQYAPIVDGYVLPTSVADIFAESKQNHVALIIGWNADEFGASPITSEAFKKQAQEKYGNDAATFLKYFPAGTDERATRSGVELARDQMFAVSGYKWAKLQSTITNSPVYVYNFVRKIPATGEFVKYGAFHTGEVAYVMNNLKFLNNRPFTAGDNELAELMSDYWVNFVKTGDPNGKGLPEWPKYNTTGNLAKIFDVPSKTEKLPGKGGLDFLLSRAVK